jgi:hypothetical protein
MMTCTREQRHQQSIANTAMPELKNVNAINMTIMIAGGMKNMNSLFDRLKPEHKATLEKQADLYPSSIKHIYMELKGSYSFIDLKYGSVIALSSFCSLPNYEILTINNLFEKHENISS